MNANFAMGHSKMAEATTHLRHILALKTKTDDDEAFARRMLALALASQGDYSQWRESAALLGLEGGNSDPSSLDSDSIDELRAKANVLAALPSAEHRRGAIKMLEAHDQRARRSTPDGSVPPAASLRVRRQPDQDPPVRSHGGEC